MLSLPRVILLKELPEECRVGVRLPYCTAWHFSSHVSCSWSLSWWFTASLLLLIFQTSILIFSLQWRWKCQNSSEARLVCHHHQCCCKILLALSCSQLWSWRKTLVKLHWNIALNNLSNNYVTSIATLAEFVPYIFFALICNRWFFPYSSYKADAF